MGIGTYLALASVLFGIGSAGFLVRRNMLIQLMSIELMLNSVNLTFVAAGRELGVLEGQLSVLFVMVVAAAEVTVARGLRSLSDIVVATIVASVSWLPDDASFLSPT